MKKEPQRVSVEYCHIYTDEDFGVEHSNAIKHLKATETEYEGSVIERVVMIDNYSPEEHTLNIEKFLLRLKENGAEPDKVVMEGDLVESAHTFLNLVNNRRLRSSYERYIEKNDGYVPCSLFIATWNAIRLGIIRDHKFQVLPADLVISILPRRFEIVEQKGIELVSNTDYADYKDKIIQQYFDEVQNVRIPKH